LTDQTQQSSPDFLRVSLAAAMTLGLRPGIFYRGAQLHCLNLLLTYPEGCYAKCSYCGLARGQRQGQSFIRVEWPTFSLDEILSRAQENCTLFERVCVSMVMHPRAVEDSRWVVEKITTALDLPVSVLVNPSSMKDGHLDDLFAAGADMASIAIDAATSKVFAAHRGKGVNGPHNWNTYWSTLEEAVRVFGRGQAGCHLISGLGETEAQMVETMQRVHDLGAGTHLFSFFPEQGSQLESSAPCPAGQWRRIQLARFLIDYGLSSASGMEFDEWGMITGFGVSKSDIDALIESGEPFMTSGCRGATMRCACNRPFGDGPPGDIRSFPFSLAAADAQRVRKELATYVDGGVNKVSESLDVGRALSLRLPPTS